MAGLSYLRNDLSAARRHLKRAPRIDPRDRYANESLGTLFYLEENTEAALFYWNRAGKPRAHDVHNSSPGVDPILLDRAFAFSPAAPLALNDYRTTQTWLSSLDVFQRQLLDLVPNPDGTYDVRLHTTRRTGWAGVVSSFRGLFYQTVHPELRNLGGKAVNWTAMLRWDAQKRRVSTALAGPFKRRPEWRYRFYGDGRSETWNLGSPDDFRMEKVTAGAEIRHIPNWRIASTNGIELAARNFVNSPAFSEGFSLKYTGTMEYHLVNDAQRRFQLMLLPSLELGRILSGARERFAKLQATLAGHCRLRWRGTDYEMRARLRGGETKGEAPFDELFILGVERDNELWLRGHAGTRNGKKGSAPIGRSYVLSNWELDRDVVRRGFFNVRAGPFVDAGRVYRRPLFGSNKWLADVGVQIKLQLLGGTTFVASYGRDLRSSSHAV